MRTLDRLATARRGFTLAEMTVIALLIGVVVTLAAPRLLPDGDPVNDVPSRRQLAILRNAIEMYRAHAGFYPPANKLPEVMETLLHEPLAPPVYAPLNGRSTVYYDLDHNVAKEVVTQPNAEAGWAYKPANGTIKFNVSPRDVSANW
ncbi:type II secretion protein [Rhodopirellula maiorica SM1]|uniref:Type II secretion protein n=1 Tax=Rhodopirellula maiorica SM1 TaxID=1265738 RepID=M5RND3_9BACT|nr:type II secretion protein [Rhodopirellula maiorica]EMI20823.1 type II secretion protein [Rhodopirellula maiorica SM1]